MRSKHLSQRAYVDVVLDATLMAEDKRLAFLHQHLRRENWRRALMALKSVRALSREIVMMFQEGKRVPVGYVTRVIDLWERGLVETKAQQPRTYPEYEVLTMLADSAFLLKALDVAAKAKKAR